MICEFHEKDPLFSGINLSRNRGHQNALLAGLMTVMDDADMVISMDADLQDDINAMDEMIDKYLDGCDIVYGVRSKRATDTFFKRFTAEGFYHLMNMMGADIVFNHADYRLMSRRALHGLAQFKEVNLFLRGLIPMIGYRTDYVLFERSERFAGESKYPLKKMLALAMDGITSLEHQADSDDHRNRRFIYSSGVCFVDLVDCKAVSWYSKLGIRFADKPLAAGWNSDDFDRCCR